MSKTRGAASLAVDGNANGNWRYWDNGAVTEGSCTHTVPEFRPWWAVDLGSQKTVFEVQITNRMDCCSGTTQLMFTELVRKCNDFAEYVPESNITQLYWLCRV